MTWLQTRSIYKNGISRAISTFLSYQYYFNLMIAKCLSNRMYCSKTVQTVCWPHLIICIMKLLSFDTYTILKDRYTIYIYYNAYILSGRYFARLLSDEQTTACHLSFLFLATFTTPLFSEWFRGNYDLKQISQNKT